MRLLPGDGGDFQEGQPTEDDVLNTGACQGPHDGARGPRPPPRPSPPPPPHPHTTPHAALHGMSLHPIDAVWVVDSTVLPFNRAEVYHQFHNGLGASPPCVLANAAGDP